MLKGVIFDLDGTLYDYNAGDMASMKNLLKEGARLLGVDTEVFQKYYEAGRREIKAELEPFDTSAQHNRLLFCQRTLELMQKNVFTYAPLLYEAYWGTMLAEMKLFKGAGDFLTALNRKGIKTAICTDMTAMIQYRKIKSLGIENNIDYMVSSEEVNHEKPHPLMFQTALQKMQLESAEVIYIGDNLYKDIQGAEKLGIKPVWIRGNEPLEENSQYLQIRDYTDERLWQLI